MSRQSIIWRSQVFLFIIQKTVNKLINVSIDDNEASKCSSYCRSTHYFATSSLKERERRGGEEKEKKKKKTNNRPHH